MTLRDEILSRQDCEAFITSRDCVAISNLMSTGRTAYRPTLITERGVRASLSISAASQFLRLLKECSETSGVPAWLSSTLTAIGVPQSAHQDYADAISSAYGWLRQDAGIDIGSTTARGMLDIIAASDSAKYGATVAALKNLAKYPDIVTPRQVAEALYNDDGTTK